MTEGQQLAEILTIVRSLSAVQSEARANSEALAELREEYDSCNKHWNDLYKKCSEAALTAQRLHGEAIWLINSDERRRNTEEWKRRRERFGKETTEYLLFCREHGVWPEYEDPYYDPNRCDCG